MPMYIVVILSKMVHMMMCQVKQLNL